MNKDPVNQFAKWFEEAVQSESAEANAMILSTVNSNNHPSSRVVLLKSFSQDGFTFFTNYESRKGIEIAHNNKVALLFFWDKQMRQVRIEGIASKIDPALSDEYFNSRPRESKASSLLSRQSKPLPDRSHFDIKIEELASSSKEIVRPATWGGYLITPFYFEFWQGGSGRAHDRFEYRKSDAGRWEITRLYP